MLELLKSEKLKAKGSLRLVIIINLVVVLNSYLMFPFGIINFSVNWYQTLFCPLLISLLVFQNYKAEDLACSWMNVDISIKSKFSIFVAKSLVVLYYLMCSAMLFTVCNFAVESFVKFLYPAENFVYDYKGTFAQFLLGNLLLTMSFSFLIPITLWLMTKLNKWVALLITVLMYFLIMPISYAFIDLHKYLFLAFPYKVSADYFGILPKGDFVKNFEIKYISSIGFTVVSCLIFGMLVYVCAKRFRKARV